MYIQLDTNNYIIGYATLGGISGGIEVPDNFIDTIDENKLNCYKYSTLQVPNTRGLMYEVTFDEDKYNKIIKSKNNQELQNKFIPNLTQSMLVYIQDKINKDSSLYTDEQKLQYSGLYRLWEPGIYKIGDIRNYAGQTWECYQAHDNNIYPDINPNNSAWYTFWKPLHGTSLETARPFVEVQGSHDTYKVGEYIVYTDGYIYKCIHETAYSPDEYAQDWEKVIIN